MFTKRANSIGAFSGGMVGTAVGVYVAFFSSLSFLWPAVFAFASALIVGYLIGLPWPITDAAKRWNWFAITATELAEETQAGRLSESAWVPPTGPAAGRTCPERLGV
ncbi:MAG: hypothetical protein HY718_16025 [Planctomycetes bacterium]|nr:hypothetical protein [Planctomycetota bacterium]